MYVCAKIKTLSPLSVLINDKVKHFYIKKKTSRGGKRRLFITEKVKFEDLQKLIKYYQNQNTDTLGTKLRVPCIKVIVITFLIE